MMGATGCNGSSWGSLSRRITSASFDSALNLHCGSMSVLVESPSHAFSAGKRNGEPFVHTPDHLLDAQLICHQEAMKLVAETGGRSRWTPGPNSKWKARPPATR
jgi:hypothetical protein